MKHTRKYGHHRAAQFLSNLCCGSIRDRQTAGIHVASTVHATGQRKPTPLQKSLKRQCLRTQKTRSRWSFFSGITFDRERNSKPYPLTSFSTHCPLHRPSTRRSFRMVNVPQRKNRRAGPVSGAPPCFVLLLQCGHESRV
jgi:hypothetical protein